MKYKAILHNPISMVEVVEISDEEEKDYTNGGVYSYCDVETRTSYMFAVGETERIALEKLCKGIEGMAQTAFNAYQEYIRQLNFVERFINNKENE